ncbi:hypothetical protein EI94DRAFT_1815543 [Lactarius quietus]|nr:hypothetical protein EI94DRAFT_1815543 [Lactarius quietus]
MTIPALWPELESILPAGQTRAVYDSAVKYFLSLEETWENCPCRNWEVSQWLYYFESAWKSLKRASQLANVDMHPDEVYAFHERVRNKAAPVASVKWISRFPTVIAHDINRFVLHAAVLSHAQASSRHSLYTQEVISYEERCWHLEKFTREHNEMLEGRQAIRDWVAASLQALADESPSLAQLAQHTGGARSTAPVLGDNSDADGIGEDDLTLPPAYGCRFFYPSVVLSAWLSSLSFNHAQRLMADPSLFLPPVSTGRVPLAYPDAVCHLLFLEESWATCPCSTAAVTIWLHYFQLAWDDVCSAVCADGEDQLREAAEAFHLRVATEALSVALVDWVRKFLSITATYSQSVSLGCFAVVLPPGMILDPFASAQDEIDVWLEHGAISLDEYSWHHALFNRERDTKIRDRTAVLAPLLSQFAAAYRLPMITTAIPDPSADGPDYEEWLDFSSGDIDAYYMSATLVLEDYHCTDAKWFHQKVVAEALLVASVDWIREYPSLSGMSAGLLVTHATAILQAQCSVTHAYHASIISPGSIPHPLHIAECEIQGMLAWAMISFKEYQWHNLQFAGECYDEDHYDDSVSVTILGTSGASRLLSALRAIAWPSPVPEESSGSVDAGENDRDIRIPESENEEGVEWYPEEDADQ